MRASSCARPSAATLNAIVRHLVPLKHSFAMFHAMPNENDYQIHLNGFGDFFDRPGL